MRFGNQVSVALAFLAASAGALAHDGHRLSGSHWHATDTSGFALMMALTGIAIWLSRGD